jgi:4'-phosphopantetheinyl transferase
MMRVRHGSAAVPPRAEGRILVAIAPTSRFAGSAVTDSDVFAAAGLPPRQATESLAARALVRRLLAVEVGAAAAAATIATRPGGQPYLPAFPRVAISLSHGQGHLAAAVGFGIAVGVDVQVPVAVSPAVLRRCCPPYVRDELIALPAAERDAEFAWIWTAQEACVKATGTGFAGRPWTIPIRRDRTVGQWNGHRWIKLRSQRTVPASLAYACSPGAADLLLLPDHERNCDDLPYSLRLVRGVD